MNLHKLSIAAVILAALSCSKDETGLPAVMEPERPVVISVIDGGYAADGTHSRPYNGSRADAPLTRAVENGYRTEFTEGDACGLYIVRDGVVTVANLKLTATVKSDGTGDVAWATEEPMWYVPGDECYLYYPWQEIPQGSPVIGDAVTADDDAGFFSGMIASWQPAADQSDFAAYTASDLMTAKGAAGIPAGGKMPLSFSMTHRMALAVIELPKTKYELTDIAGGKIPDYIVPNSADFGENKPYSPTPGTYRYIVNPSAQSAPTLSGSYDDGKKEFTITPTGITAGNYKTYKVDGAKTETKTHQLQIGDFFLADGHLLSKDADVSEVQPADVVGIVFQTDPDRIGQAEKDALGGAARGLVMSVKNAEPIGLQWGPTGQDEGLTPCITKADNYNDISGYGNCDHIRTNRKGFDSHPAFKAADDYNTTCPVPNTTTGWYLPASGQWWDILQNLGGCTALADEDQQTSLDIDDFYWSGQGDVPAALNAWMEKIASDSKDNFNSGDWFWSSSEYSDSRARYWFVISNANVRCDWRDKYRDRVVRPVLAF